MSSLFLDQNSHDYEKQVSTSFAVEVSHEMNHDIARMLWWLFVDCIIIDCKLVNVLHEKIKRIQTSQRS